MSASSSSAKSSARSIVGLAGAHSSATTAPLAVSNERGAAVPGGGVDHVAVPDAGVGEYPDLVGQQHGTDERRREVGRLVDDVTGGRAERVGAERGEDGARVWLVAGAHDDGHEAAVRVVQPDRDAAVGRQAEYLRDLVGGQHEPGQPHHLVRHLAGQQRAVDVQGVLHPPAPFVREVDEP